MRPDSTLDMLTSKCTFVTHYWTYALVCVFSKLDQGVSIYFMKKDFYRDVLIKKYINICVVWPRVFIYTALKKLFIYFLLLLDVSCTLNFISAVLQDLHFIVYWWVCRRSCFSDISDSALSEFDLPNVVEAVSSCIHCSKLIYIWEYKPF